MFDELGEVFYKKGIEKQLENTGVNIKDVFFKKSFFKGFDCINQEYITSEILEGFELETLHIGKIFWKQNIQFTIGFNLPKLYYDLKPSYYDNLIYDFNILQNYDGVEFIDERLFSVNSKDIRDVNTYDLKSMVEFFIEDCRLNGISIPFNINILSSFEVLESNTSGVSLGMDNDDVILKIDPEIWSKSSLTKRWYIIYHELGHDVLNLQHGEGGKMMFTFSDREYKWEEFFQDKEYMFDYFKKNSKE